MIIKDKFDFIAEQARGLLGHDKPQEAVRLITKSIGRLSCPPSLVFILAEAYFQLGMKLEASVLVSQYVDSTPKSIATLKNAVSFYVRNKDYENALFHIDQAIKLFPLSASFVTDRAAILFKQGNIEEAATTLLKKLVYGKLVDEDAPLIKDLRKGFKLLQPGSIVANSFLSHPEVNKIYTRAIFDRGISLGTDCEFGTAQRLMGQEPLDLLRWGTIPFDALVTLLSNRFSDFASPGSVSFNLSTNDDTGSWEYHFVDNVYGLQAHTLHNPVSMGLNVTEDEVLEKMRLHFFMLARKMQDDLEDAEKFFVYKSKIRLDVSECKRLSEALNLYGDNKLLVIMPRDDLEDNFEAVEPNLHVGRLQKFWHNAKLDDEGLNAWSSIISQSWQHFIKQYPYMDEI
jgi:hypothetical protein